MWWRITGPWREHRPVLQHCFVLFSSENSTNEFGEDFLMMSGMLTHNGLSRLGPETSFEIFKLGELSSVSGAGLPPHSMVTHQKKIEMWSCVTAVSPPAAFPPSPMTWVMKVVSDSPDFRSRIDCTRAWSCCTAAVSIHHQYLKWINTLESTLPGHSYRTSVAAMSELLTV
jgi:hypothetical protein